MCVAVIVDTDKPVPLRHLKAMESANPDGAGLAWVDGEFIQYRKGLTAQQIFDMQDMLPRPFFMHFRIATRGAKIPELTHPFPLGMQAFSDDLLGMAPAVLMHNGTWSDFRKHVPEGIDADKVSDTQTAAYVCESNEEVLSEVGWSNAIMKAIGNGRCNITIRGRWSEGLGDEDGMHYSNTYWKSELYVTRTYTHQYPKTEDEWSAYFKNKYPEYADRYADRTRPTVARTTTPLVTPIIPRKKGLSHQEGRNQENGKTLSKRQQKRLAKLARRAEKRNASKVISQYDKALIAYNKNRNAYWDGEPLFTPDALAKAKAKVEATAIHDDIDDNAVCCDDCGIEIEIIPCPCNNWTVEEWIAHSMRQDEILDSAELEALEESGLDLDVQNVQEELDFAHARDTIDLDVEDMNAYGMSAGMDGGLEDLILDGDHVGDWQQVDAAIRKQGIKL